MTESTAAFEIRGQRGQWHWALVGANGETMGTSETYTRKADARRAIGDATNAVLDTLRRSA